MSHIFSSPWVKAGRTLVRLLPVLGLLFGIVPLALADPVEPGTEDKVIPPVRPYVLKVIAIVCIETEDFVGGDHPYLHVNGTRQWGPVRMVNGQSESINKDVPFSGTVEILLFEEDDADDDDYLGMYTVREDEAGLGTKTVSFTGDGANYRLTYEVVRAP